MCHHRPSAHKHTIVKVILALIIFSLYFGAGAVLLWRLLQDAASGSARRIALVLATGGAALHLVFSFRTLPSLSALPLDFFGAGSLIGWLMVALLLITALSRPVENLGIVTFPLVGLVVLLNVWLAPSASAGKPLPAEITVHVVSSIVAYSVLAIAAIQALVLAFQEHRLRSRHPGGLVRFLPPLQTMEHMLFQMVGLGFILLTLALGTGFVFLEDMFAQHLAHKTVLSLLAWLLFGTLLLGRWRFGWRGQTAIRWALGGFLVLMLGFFGSKFVLELILQRG